MKDSKLIIGNEKIAYAYDFTLIDKRLKVLHIVDMTWTFFVINKGTWIDYMKWLQVSAWHT